MSDDDFLRWVLQRLIHYHGYKHDNKIIVRLQDIISHKFSKNNINISDKDLDTIISKYYVDYLLDKDDTTPIGWTENDRNTFRTIIKQIIDDTLTHDDIVCHDELVLEDFIK